MRIFLSSGSRRQGHYMPAELAMLDQICRTASLRLGLEQRDDIEDLALAILSLYDLGNDDPEAILHEIVLIFSAEQRLKRHGRTARYGIAA